MPYDFKPPPMVKYLVEPEDRDLHDFPFELGTIVKMSPKVPKKYPGESPILGFAINSSDRPNYIVKFDGEIRAIHPDFLLWVSSPMPEFTEEEINTALQKIKNLMDQNVVV